MGWVPIRGSPEGEPPSGKGPGGCAPSFQKTSEGGRVGPPNVCRGDTPETPPPATIPPSKAQSPDAPTTPASKSGDAARAAATSPFPPTPSIPYPTPHAAPHASLQLSLRRPQPHRRRSPTPPQLKVQGLPCLAASFRASPCAVRCLPIWESFPRSPSAAFVSYLRPSTQTRDWQTSAKLGRVADGHSNEANPSCADFCAVPVP